MNEIIIMIGIPGSGKSKYVDKYLSSHQLICSDDIKKVISIEFFTTWVFFNSKERYKNVSAIDIIAKTSCKAYMKRGRSIVIDDLNITKEKISEWLDFANKYNYKKVAIILKETLNKCILRRSDFPNELLTEMYKKFNSLLEDNILLERFDNLKFGGVENNV